MKQHWWKALWNNIAHFHTKDVRIRSVIMPKYVTWLGEQSLSVRFATLQDCRAMVFLEKVGYQGYIAWSRADFEQDLMMNPYAVYVLCWEGETLIAMITGRMLYKKAHISHLIVHPDYRGKGYALQLLKIWELLAQQEGSQRLTLEVQQTNTIAIALYKRFGFIADQIVEQYYRSGENAVQMTKHL